MTKYKVGDKVRLLVDLGDEYPVGAVGTVVPNTTPNSRYEYKVEFPADVDTYPMPVHAKEIELVTEAEPEAVEHPSHYQHPSGVEVIEIIKHESFLRGNIIKYVMRAPYKGAELQDMLKAREYLSWEIERLEAQGD